MHFGKHLKKNMKNMGEADHCGFHPQKSHRGRGQDYQRCNQDEGHPHFGKGRRHHSFTYRPDGFGRSGDALTGENYGSESRMKMRGEQRSEDPAAASNSIPHCTLCRNNCPLTEPGCPKGEALAASRNIQSN